jgi:hypothetical protein
MVRTAKSWIVTASLALLTLSCDGPNSRSPLGPAGFGTQANAAGGTTSTWIRSSFVADAIAFIDCLGENAHIFGEVPFILHQVTNWSGGTLTFLQLSPITPSGPSFSLQGLSSGRLYQLQNGLPVNEMMQSGPDGTFSHQERGVFVNVADGHDKVYATFRAHMTINANGTVTVDRSEFRGFFCVSH